jgi:hypothetical protein
MYWQRFVQQCDNELKECLVTCALSGAWETTFNCSPNPCMGLCCQQSDKCHCYCVLDGKSTYVGFWKRTACELMGTELQPCFCGQAPFSPN